VLIGGIVLGLVLGLLAGGSVDHLARIRLRWAGVIFAALIGRFAIEWAISAGIPVVETLRAPLYGAAFGALLAGLWANRSHPGLSLAFAGIASNTAAVLANGGHMPVWEPSLVAAGFSRSDIGTAFHTVLPAALDARFLLRLGFLGDVLPIPIPLVRNVASVGDLFLSAGLGFFLFATVLGPVAREAGLAELVARRWRGRGPEALADRAFAGPSGLAPGLAEAAALERPLVLGAGATGAAAPGRAGAGALVGPEVVAPPIPGLPRILARLRRHPYVRLALNGSFSGLWAGQVISLFGDRVHQVALLFLVLHLTDSPAAVAAVLVVTTIPNLFLGPIAGAYVDRWDPQEVMVVSDLLRAAVVLLIPMAAVTNLALVFPLVFVVTAISIFFRPARVAVLTRVVDEDELLAANSAMWVGETMADIVGYPLAGLFVAFLGAALPLAFWIDGATYAVSAVLIAAIVVRPLAAPAGAAVHAAAGILARAREGWQFLRREAVLLANTVQAVLGQIMIGIVLALMPLYARDVVRDPVVGPEAAYSFLEAGIGLGNLVGGFAIGLIGTQIGLGRLVIAGYALTGGLVALLGLTGNFGIALALVFGVGIGNLVFVIPSQTLFQQRTPPELIGRVIGLRYSLTFGAMTIGIALAGVLGSVFGTAPVISLFGVVTLAAGLAGLLVPSVRDA
jgi:MFS family permease